MVVSDPAAWSEMTLRQLITTKNEGEPLARFPNGNRSFDEHSTPATEPVNNCFRQAGTKVSKAAMFVSTNISQFSMSFQQHRNTRNPTKLSDTAAFQQLAGAFLPPKTEIIINTTITANPMVARVVEDHSKTLTQLFPPLLQSSRTSRNCIEDKKFIRIRVPKNVCSKVVSDRVMNEKYETNNHTKAAALFLLLKALTRSGKIQDWRFQQIEISAMLDITTRTLSKWISLAEARGYVKREKFTDIITLISYEKFCECFDDVKFTGFHTLIVPRAAIKQLPVLLYGIEVKENKESQQFYIVKKVLLNPQLVTALKDELRLDQRDLQQQMKRRQLSSFLLRSKGDQLLHTVNADDNRNLANIRVAWGMKDRRSAAYVKKKLMKCGAAHVQHRRITSMNGMWTKTYHTSFDSQTGMRTTFLPDEITLSPSIYQ